MKSEKTIKKLLLIVPILGVVISSFSLTKIFIYEIKQEHNKEIKALVLNEEMELKNSIKNKINNVINLLEQSYISKFEREKNEIKNTVDIAYNIIDSTYQKNKHLKKEEILELIKNRLRPLRFYKNLSGYYFIFNKEGKSLLLPHLREYENRDFLNSLKTEEKLVINTFLDFLKKQNKGFLNWLWFKPNEAQLKNKLGYIKEYKNLGIFFGSAKYIEDINSNIKKDLLDILNLIRFENKNYIFAYDEDGTTLAHIKKSLISTNRWYLKKDNRYIIQELIKASKNKEGAYLEYIATINPLTNKAEKKLSFVREFNRFNWSVGTGAYLEQFTQNIKAIQKRNLIDLEKMINEIIRYSIFITLIILVLMYAISNRISHIFNRYKNILEKTNKSLERKVLRRTKELRQSEEKLKNLALHDPLTGLYNRRYFDDIIKQLVALSKRKKEDLSLLIIDIDKFKLINDNYGHDVGDIVLKNLAIKLLDLLRKSDIVIRFGGEEFVIVFPNTNIETSFILASKLRKEIEDLEIKINDNTIKFTISIGLSTFDFDLDTDIKEVIKRADEALYIAKKSGRNKIVKKL